jgi:protein-tyrosine phosphatase
MRRVVTLEGCLNFRDVGGYPTAGGRRVRWRQVFRSDALHRLTSTDVVHLRDELGVGCIVDLRSSAELRSDGRGALAAEAIAFHHIPLFDGHIARPEAWSGQPTLADRYVLLAEFAKEAIARVLRVLAATDRPAVYHCAAGKDRTGVISAVLLALLGVPDEVIVADYAATQENLDAIVERLLETEGYQTMLAALPPDTMHAEADTMVAFLNGIRKRYGSMRAYAVAAGLDEETVERLVARLVER